MSDYSIYVVDDEVPLAKGLSMTLAAQYQTRPFFSGRSVLDALEKAPCDLLLLDIGLPDMNGIAVLQEVKKRFPETAVIMITAFDQVETVVSAMKAGAHDYVVKPVQPDSLEITVENAIETIRLRKEIRELQEKYLQENLPFFIGESRKIQSVMRFVRQVAASPDTPVLILGESGTGKELIASAIHCRSPRFKGPLISINCAAIPENLIESELFGYEKGAFSGALVTGKKGLIEQAHNGTLFLDEIGDLSLNAQARFLRFLEGGLFYKVGGTKEIRVNTRIVSATNKNPESMIGNGTFRADLWFRISVVKIEVPSLNERPEDIVLIARHFLVAFSEKFGKKIHDFSPEAIDVLKSNHWKGNVRELKNAVERAVLVSSETQVGVEDLGLVGNFSVPGNSTEKNFSLIPAQGIDLPCILENTEKRYIRAVLDITGGNEARAAQLLNIKYSTFRYRRKKLGIS